MQIRVLENEIDKFNFKIAAIRRKNITNMAMLKLITPIKEQIEEKRIQLDELEAYLQKITPFHERLDPESTFYKHYMQKVETEKIVEQANQIAAEDSDVLKSIASKLGYQPKAP